MKERYFQPVNGGWTPISQLSDRISRWDVANLMSPAEIAPFACASIVFCRNGFIYFSPDSIRRVVDSLALEMPTPGFLCVGASESLLRLTKTYLLEEIGGAFIYVKRGPHE